MSTLCQLTCRPSDLITQNPFDRIIECERRANLCLRLANTKDGDTKAAWQDQAARWNTEAARVADLNHITEAVISAERRRRFDATEVNLPDGMP